MAQAHERGYASVGNTPEYKRGQREREAQAQGRTLPTYVPQAEQNRIARMARVERQADQVRAKWAAEWLRPFRSEKALYRTDDEYRQAILDKSREYYWSHHVEAREKVANYKATHSGRVLQWSRTRADRIAKTSDGSLTPDRLAQMRSDATECAYCGCGLGRHRHTDHMVAVCHDGEHSERNVVVTCPSCNGKKAALTYAEWIERVEPQHRSRVIALWEQRYGKLAA